jgi:hypothetical protein
MITDPRRRRLAALFVIVLALSFVPMAGTLGYFSSLLLAPLLSLFAAAAGVDAVLEVRKRAPAERDAAWLELIRALAGSLAAMLGLTLGLLLLGMLWNRNCDPLGGFGYFVIGPVCSSLLGAVAGVAAAIVLGERRRWQLLLGAFVPFVVCVVIGVRRLYVDPAVFAYDPFFGWFSGPIYDEGVAISLTYLRYRAYNFTIAAAVWLALRAGVDERLHLSVRRMLLPGRNRIQAVAALVLASVGMIVGLSAAKLGFAATTDSLADTLGATRETEHFVIHYGPTSPTSREIDMVAAEHEFAWQQLEHKLGRAPERKVHSFVFLNGKQRGALIGANVVEVSPPWRQQMYLSHRTWPHDIMHHELAHAFLGDLGDPLLGLPIAGGRVCGALIEGLPTALAPRSLDNLDQHEQAAVLDRPPLANIMGAGFWGAAASRAYTASGSFVLWLAQTRGWPAVAQLYDNACDFEASVGAPLDELEQEWLAFLRGLALRERDVEALAQRFQRGSVLERPCAHRVAELRAAANKARLLDHRDDALEHQRTLCRIEPEEPGHFVGLADMLASWQRFDEAIAVLDELADRAGLTPSIRAAIEEQRGDADLLADAREQAAAHYQAAMQFGLGEGSRRQLQIKLAATTDPALAPLLIDYFRPFQLEDDSRVAALLQLWTAKQIAALPGWQALGNYLLGRLFLNVEAPREAAEVLRVALAPALGEPPLSSPELLRAAYLLQLSALLQLQEWDRAEASLAPLLELAEGNGHVAVVDEWRERIAFFRGYFAELTPG